MGVQVRSLVRSVDEQWGGLVDAETNAWSGMVGMLQRGEADIQLGALTVLAAREKVPPTTSIL